MTTTKNKAPGDTNSENLTHDTNKKDINELDPYLLTQDAFCNEIVLAMMENR